MLPTVSLAPLSRALYPWLDQNPPTPSNECTQTALDMAAHHADPTIPVTIAYRAAMGGDAGDDGMSAAEVNTLCARLWNRTPRHPRDVDDFITRLVDYGDVAVCQGNNATFAAELRHGYAGIHALAIGPGMRLADGAVWLWVRDPIPGSGFWLPWQGHPGYNVYDWCLPVVSSSWLFERNGWTIANLQARLGTLQARVAVAEANATKAAAALAAASVTAYNTAIVDAGTAAALAVGLLKKPAA